MEAATVENLDRFPFKDFGEFRRAHLEGAFSLAVAWGVAYDWARNGVYAPRLLGLQLTCLAFIPVVASLGLVAYAILSRTWLLLLCMPLLPVWFQLCYPGTAFWLGGYRSGLILVACAGLAFALLDQRHWLVALTCPFVAIAYAHKAIFGLAVKSLRAAVVEHEDLLCGVWEIGGVNVQFRNGDTYSLRHKVEGGCMILYGLTETTDDDC